MRISAILGIFGILAIMFLLSGCSFKYFDPQWYKFKSLVKKESGFYIYDKDLFQEYNKKGVKNILSNGYDVKYNTDETIRQLDSRLTEYKRFEVYYIDSSGKEHIISYIKGFTYTHYGLWLKGDEGRGFYWETKETIDREATSKNKFYMEEKNNDK